MELSRALSEVWEFVYQSPTFRENSDCEAFKIFKQLYKEVVAVEKEDRESGWEAET
jgi:hypothetical protein